MIQAPNLSYIPAQNMIPMAYPQQGAQNAIQYVNTTPGVIYNYPTSSCYMPQQAQSTAKSQYNGVNIEIINPQGQAVPNQMAQAPACYYPQMPIQYPAAPAVPAAPAAPVMQPVQTPVAPAPVVPAPVVNADVPVAATPVPAPAPVATPAETPAAAPVNADATKTAEAFAGKLNTTDLDAQRLAIEEIAEAVKNNQTMGADLLDTTVVDGLVGVINTDTSAMQKPTPEVLELRQKPQDQMTDEEKTKAMTPSQYESAQINKQYALYTLSYMQERLINEIAKADPNAAVIEMKDLPAIETVISTAKSNEDPELRIAAISALSHIQRPEYKADLTTIFELAKADADPRVQEAATGALASLTA